MKNTNLEAFVQGNHIKRPTNEISDDAPDWVKINERTTKPNY